MSVERLSKRKALQLFDWGILGEFEPGTTASLFGIHEFLFEGIDSSAGQRRDVELRNGNFRFVPVMYLGVTLLNIEQMPQRTFDEIVEKFVEMHVAHPFRKGNGVSLRIWLDLILKQELGVVVDWRRVNKDDYLLAMERSPIRDIEIKHWLRGALTRNADDRKVYMAGIDQSYSFDGYDAVRMSELDQFG